MAEDRIVISSEPSLSAEEVARRSFATAFRGYDTSEVRAFLRRAAQELSTLHDREKDLRARYEEARQKAAHPQLDEATLTAALGDEAARLIRSAREVAADITGKAEQKVARLVKEAQEESTRLKAEAEAVLTRRTEEADAAATGLRDAAKAEADALRDAARAEAAAEIEAAKARGREIVLEAQALRERLLGDLARRRKLGVAQVEQLRAGRDRLLDAYRVVRRTLEEVTEELTVAENEARVAAENAARRTAADAEATLEQLEAEIAAEKADAKDGVTVDLTAAEEAVPTVVDLTDPAPSPESAPAPEPAPVALDGDSSAGDERPLTAPTPITGRRGGGVRVLRRTESSAEPVLAPPAPEPVAHLEAVARLVEAPPIGASVASNVEELFARIKADRADAVAKAEEILAVDIEIDIDAGAIADGDPAADVAPVPDELEEALQRRDRALEPIDTALVRKLKRALQDEQNVVLEALRHHRGKAAPEAVLPAEDEARARYREVALPLLRKAAEAGAEFAGGHVNGLDIGPLADDLAAELVAPLRERLVRGIAEGLEADDEETVIAERIGAGYREWKVQRVERAARDRAAAAFARGSFAALGDDAMVRWVVDDEGGPCPDCDDDALAGVVRKGEAFPTGQQHPPAHAGCRCLLVPSSA